MQIEERDTDSLTPYPNNPRINDNAVSAVAESIKQFGFRQPIVIDAQDVIVCGHTRWKAAQKLGLKRVPVHVATDLTPAQLRAYRIADNKTNDLASFDLDKLANELIDLKEEPIDWKKLGFTSSELGNLLSPVEVQCAPRLGEHQYQIIVDCDDEESQRMLLQRLQAEGVECRAVIL